jgi:hypothetical protein
MSRDVFKKIAESTPTGGGNYLTYGAGRLLVHRISFDRKRSGEAFILEGEIVQNKKNHLTEECDPPGSKRTFMQNGFGTDNGSEGRTKAVILALAGLPEKTPPDLFVAELEKFCDEKNPGRGMLLDFASYNVETKKGVKLPGFNWVHVKQTPEEIAAIRAEMDKA